MTTLTHIERFRGPFDLSRGANDTPRDEGAKLRELWSDSVATVAVVTLASVVVFETLRVMLW